METTSLSRLSRLVRCVIASVLGVALSAASHAPAWAQNTYTWNVSGSNAWTTASNWSPARTSPATNDILVFDGTVTPSPFITGVPTQTIGKLVLQNGIVVALNSSSPVTLTIAGGTGLDLDVPPECRLMTLGGLNSPSLSLGSGATGTIGGNLDAANQVLALGSGALAFEDGATMTCMTAPGAHVFGTTNLNSVVFHSGSTFVSSGGGDPFGASAPNSVVTFETGSLYRHQQTAAPALSGRTYADFELISSGFNSTLTGALQFTVDDFKVVAGTLHVRLTNVVIKGDLVRSGSATLDFNPTSPQSISLSGTTPQTVIGSPTFNANAHVTVSNPVGVTFQNTLFMSGDLTLNGGDVTVVNASNLLIQGGNLQLTNGVLHAGLGFVQVSPGTVLGGNASSYVHGSLRRSVNGSGLPVSVRFDVGDAATYAPVTLAFPSISNGGSLTASTQPGDHSNIATSGLDASSTVNRTWTIANQSVAFPSCDATFGFAPEDMDPGTDPDRFRIWKFDAPNAWTLTATGTRTATSTQGKGIASFSDFQIGTGRTGVTDVTLTADNVYRLGFGPVTGPTAATLLPAMGGLAEEIYTCLLGPETWGLDPANSDYLYVAAFSDLSVLTGFIGQATGSGTIVTGDPGWEVYASGVPPSTSNFPDSPTLAQIQTEIAKANSMTGGPGSSVGWVGPSGGAPGTVGVLALGDLNDGTGDLPYMCVERIPAHARWIWYNPDPATYPNPFVGPGVPGEFLIFRFPVSQVPDNGAYTLQTVVAGAPGSIDQSIVASTYPVDTEVELTATPGPTSFFAGWYGSIETMQNPTTITINANKVVFANFIQGYVLTKTGSPPEGGTIQAAPEQPFYLYDTRVDLTATAAPGWALTNWTGTFENFSNPSFVRMQGNKSVTAHFIPEATAHTLTLLASPPGLGGASPSPPSISSKYSDGQSVTLTATPAAKFTEWSGDASGSTNPITIVMDADKTVTANFSDTRFINVTIDPPNHGSVTRDPDLPVYEVGAVVRLTAVPLSINSFVQWDDLFNNTHPTTPEIDVTVVADMNFVAHFTNVVAVEPIDHPTEVRFDGLLPQPTREGGSMRFAVPSEGHVRLALRSVSGRLVRVLLDEMRPAGEHSVAWDGRDATGRPVPSGVYFASLDTPWKSFVKRVVVVR